MEKFESKDTLLNRIMHFLSVRPDGVSVAVISSRLRVKEGKELMTRLSWLIDSGYVERIETSRIYNGLSVKTYRRIK